MTDYTDLIAALRLPIHGAQQEWTCRKAADALEALAGEVVTLTEKNGALADDVRGLQATFDLMWAADMRAIKLWQAADGAGPCVA